MNMSPRNQDDTHCGHFPGDCNCSQNLDFTPTILHKKHKVIKLIEAQLLHLQGLFDCSDSKTAVNAYSRSKRATEIPLDVDNDDGTDEALAQIALHRGSTLMNQSNEPTSPLLWLAWLALLLTALFIMGLLAAWLSAGYLSNRAPHTPIHWISPIKTDGICELERKYLLRWSTSNHLE